MIVVFPSNMNQVLLEISKISFMKILAGTLQNRQKLHLKQFLTLNVTITSRIREYNECMQSKLKGNRRLTVRRLKDLEIPRTV